MREMKWRKMDFESYGITDPIALAEVRRLEQEYQDKSDEIYRKCIGDLEVQIAEKKRFDKAQKILKNIRKRKG